MKKQVIIAEDSSSTKQALKTALELHDYNVVGEASNGLQAMTLYKELKPDLVLMDIAMPKMHGIAAIRGILKINRKAKIIAITALYSEEKQTEILETGAKACILKPFDVPILIKTINEIIA
jgi:two-component system chemotaxis response regulator CheY